MFVSTIKELGYEKYYDHIPYIHNVITPKSPPKICFPHEERIKAMFLQIQIPFRKHCPKEPKNFLSCLVSSSVSLLLNE
jgi:hypothetical protein